MRQTPKFRFTIRDLLLHTSGLNHRTSDVYREAQVRSGCQGAIGPTSVSARRPKTAGALDTS